MQKGTLFVVSGPSGCGKGTVLAEINKDPKVHISVSAATRKPRLGEVDGVDYYFMETEKFEELIKQDGMLEHAVYCDHYYGTPKKPVEEQRNAGYDIILEIEVVGAMKVKAACPDAVLVFILPPTLSELERRLLKRGTEPKEVVMQRIARAKEEMLLATQYDYVIVNGPLEEAVRDMRAVIQAERIQRTDKNLVISEVLSK